MEGCAHGAEVASHGRVGIEPVDAGGRYLPEHLVKETVVRGDESMIASLCHQNRPIGADIGIHDGYVYRARRKVRRSARQQQAADIGPSRRYAVGEVDNTGQRAAREDVALHDPDIGIQKAEVRGQCDDRN